jgi:hypothetical protein
MDTAAFPSDSGLRAASTQGTSSSWRGGSRHAYGLSGQWAHLRRHGQRAGAGV